MYSLIDDMTDAPPTAKVDPGTGDVRISWGATTLRCSRVEAEALVATLADAVARHRATVAAASARLTEAEAVVSTWPAERLDDYLFGSTRASDADGSELRTADEGDEFDAR